MFDFLKKKDKKEKIVELNVDGDVNCLADFTYSFYWSHKGEEMELEDIIPGTDKSFLDVVNLLKESYTIKINGNAGHRLASSLGVDLVYFGGDGSFIETGDIIVEGDVKSRMGISAVKGSIYVKGEITEPIGNLLEVKSDKKGYRKFKSITDILTNGLNKEKLIGAELIGNKLEINDGIVRDTVGARLNQDYQIIVNGNVDLSTGILMKEGTVKINGNAGKNTGTVLSGGTVIIDGNSDDFTAAEMKKGNIIINGNAGTFLAANKTGGTIYAKDGSAVHPTEKLELNDNDKKLILNAGFNPKGFKKFF